MEKTLFMYVNYPAYDQAIGISKKIRTQIETFKKLGYQVTYSEYLRDGVAIKCDKEVLFEYHYPINVPSKVRNLIRRFVLQRCCAKFVQGKKYSLGYIRLDTIDNFTLKLAHEMNNACKHVMMDCHGYFPNSIGHGIKGKYNVYQITKNASKITKYLDVCLSESNESKVFGVPALKIDTCIDVDKYDKHVYLGDENELNMISVTSETAYHGYDRVITGLHNYLQNPHQINVKIHFVGGIKKSTKKLIEKYHLSDNVILYGYKYGQELNNIYSQCNMGIGPLAPHREGGKPGTGIKTKEYFAIGLPYFYGGTELIVPDDYPFVHRFESCDKPIDINEVVDFWKDIKKRESVENEMRDFARENFSWEKVYKNALLFINAAM